MPSDAQLARRSVIIDDDVLVQLDDHAAVAHLVVDVSNVALHTQRRVTANAIAEEQRELSSLSQNGGRHEQEREQDGAH